MRRNEKYQHKWTKPSAKFKNGNHYLNTVQWEFLIRRRDKLLENEKYCKERRDNSTELMNIGYYDHQLFLIGRLKSRLHKEAEMAFNSLTVSNQVQVTLMGW